MAKAQAEIDRLRQMSKEAARRWIDAAGYPACPWCGNAGFEYPHDVSCGAFTPNGELKV